jgi:NAD(P)-dependent dehydrogenase (short-subunit alcohol dehydrogenase family)
MDRLAGKVALITGAGTGMGRSCVRLFAANGAQVVGVGRRLDRLQETAELVRQSGDKAEVMACDVASEPDARDLVEDVARRYGRLDILVNAAAMGGSAYGAIRPGGVDSIAETPSEHWHELLHNNLDSVFYLCHAAVNVMRRQGGGSIVNIGSMGAVRGFPAYHAYGVTKAGIHSLTRAMAVRYGRDNIRTNCIAPGTTDTPMMAGSASIANLDPGNPDRYNFNPMGRAGTPDEMAYGCLFLASDEASYVNGVVLAIDGGALSCPT